MHLNLVSSLVGKEVSSKFLSMALCFLGALSLALFAQISFTLPFTPVPVTAQSLGVLLIGAAFGAKRAFSTTCLYIVFGLIGLPVFSAGTSGLATLSGVTGGYLLGFIFAATGMGYLGDRARDRSLLSAFGCFIIGHAIIFLIGMAWLSFYVPANKILALGFTPFVPGMIFKTVAAALIMPSLWKLTSKIK